MKVKKITGVGILAGVLLMVSCSWADSFQSLVGVWKTEPVLSQLGRIVITYTFSDDGTFKSLLKYMDAKLPEMKASGTYEIAGDKLITRSETGENSSYFRFDGDELIVNDEDEEFRYHRVH